MPDSEINWRTEETRGSLPTNTPAMQLLLGEAYRLSGDEKYAKPLEAAADKTGPRALTEFNENMMDALGEARRPERRRGEEGHGLRRVELRPLHGSWQASGDKRFLEDLYADEIRTARNQHMYMHTEGHWWIDRGEIPSEEPAAHAARRHRAEAQLDLAGQRPSPGASITTRPPSRWRS